MNAPTPLSRQRAADPTLLGNDPLAWAARQADLPEGLWLALQTRQPAPTGPTALRLLRLQPSPEDLAAWTATPGLLPHLRLRWPAPWTGDRTVQATALSPLNCPLQAPLTLSPAARAAMPSCYLVIEQAPHGMRHSLRTYDPAGHPGLVLEVALEAGEALASLAARLCEPTPPLVPLAATPVHLPPAATWTELRQATQLPAWLAAQGQGWHGAVAALGRQAAQALETEGWGDLFALAAARGLDLQAQVLQTGLLATVALPANRLPRPGTWTPAALWRLALPTPRGLAQRLLASLPGPQAWMLLGPADHDRPSCPWQALLSVLAPR
ncbi:hypothetical protein [Ideonella livida]|uniref:Uncharacterized protein n=1 Tax=Ideonella livida TaxID=2707176 RepID=A0A7C9TK38_9BURK|nr:hypothetical protein [Ideonella livida]NDY91582.1 hypothetical protein [Ideonella livida]